MSKNKVTKECVSTSQNNGIGTIEFFHPKANCLTGQMLEMLVQSFNDFAKDPQIKAIVLKSSGDTAFCAGASFEEFSEITNLDQAIEFFSRFARLIVAMQRCPKFVIVRVHGKAVGGGVGIVAAADYALASKDASIKLSELEIGLGPFVIAPVVIRKVGQSKFDAMAIDCMWRDVFWSKEAGLFADIFDTSDAMDEAIERLATGLCQHSTKATSSLKKAIWEGTEDWANYLSRRASITANLLGEKLGWTSSK